MNDSSDDSSNHLSGIHNESIYKSLYESLKSANHDLPTVFAMISHSDMNSDMENTLSSTIKPFIELLMSLRNQVAQSREREVSQEDREALRAYMRESVDPMIDQISALEESELMGLSDNTLSITPTHVELKIKIGEKWGVEDILTGKHQLLAKGEVAPLA